MYNYFYQARMRQIHYIAYMICPAITVLFSLMISFVTVYIQNTMPPFFVFLFGQFYLNWYFLYKIKQKVIVPFTVTAYQESQSNRIRFWYCAKCKHYTRRPAQHCVLCRKCFYHRDHHCFFLGGCILKQNMGNFILVCLYAAFVCIYSVLTIGSYLYNYIVYSDTSKFNIYYFVPNIFFPFIPGKFIRIDYESVYLFLAILFIVSISIACFASVYGLWKLYTCLSRKQNYYPDFEKWNNVYEIFGNYGFLNLIFPLNGLLYSRNNDQKYKLKSV